MIWDWNLVTDEIFIGDQFQQLFGYKVKDNKGTINDWLKHLHPEDKEKVEKGIHLAIASSSVYWEHTFRYLRADGSIAKVIDRGSILRDKDGKAFRMVGAMQDVSRQRDLEEILDHELLAKRKLLAENNENFGLIFNSSSDVLYDNDLVAGKVRISDAYEKEYGYKIKNNITPVKDWLSHIHPNDKEAVHLNLIKAQAGTEMEWKYRYRFLKADGSIARVESKAVILRHADGKAYRMIGSMRDMSKQIVLEEKLEQQIRLKEKQMAEVFAEAKDTERLEIGKELHDNVNQLLAASILYLEMAKRGGHKSEIYLNRSSEYTLTAIEEIRKLTKGLTSDTLKTIGLRSAIENIAVDTMGANPVKISLALESYVGPGLNNKFELNVFRIVQQHLNNILTHAKATEVNIILEQNEKAISLTISDNGIGFDMTKQRKGIGVNNIRSRVLEYNGAADFISQPGRGCKLKVTFPLPIGTSPENHPGRLYQHGKRQISALD